MQISIVHKSKLERTARVDAEYYRADFISLMEVLTQKGITKLTDLCKVSDGNHMSIAKYFVNDSSGVPYFRGQDISGFFIENITPVCIPEETYHEPWMKRSHFQPNDILLTIVGTIGSISLVTEQIQKATGSCKIAILRSKRICSKYLSAFLLSKYGQQQLKRNIRGAVQTGLILEDFDQLLVYEASTNFQKIIQSLISKAILINRQSKQLYRQAEQHLLSELGLADWQPTHQPTFVRNFSDFLQADRLDAEYFQPKYQTIIEYFSNNHSIERIGQWGKVLKGRSVQYLDEGKGIPVIRSGDLIDLDNEENFKQAIPDQQFFYLQKGDICISSIGFGSIGKIQVFDKNGQYATVSEVTVIRQQRVNPYYLQLFLQSVVGQLQIERWITGATGQLHLYPRDVEKIIVPILLQEKQKEFEKMVMKSRQTKKRAKQLLDIAKRGVELAIEQDEKIAEAWIQEQMEQPAARL